MTFAIGHFYFNFSFIVKYLYIRNDSLEDFFVTYFNKDLCWWSIALKNDIGLKNDPQDGVATLLLS
jgi:hypothetical protein